MKKLVLLVVLMATSVFATYMEMSWDDGSPTGAIEFSETNPVILKLANDFALTDFTYEPERYGRITYIRVYADLVGCGFNVSIESDEGLLWGPKEMIRYAGKRWYKVYVGYKLPDPYMQFKVVLAPISETGDSPNCYVGSQTSFAGHSWQHNRTRWIYLRGITKGGERYRNLMIRVLVRDRYTAVEPTSLGRVKALYK